MPLLDHPLDQGLQLKRHIEATLGSGNIMEAVKLPPGEEFEVSLMSEVYGQSCVAHSACFKAPNMLEIMYIIWQDEGA